MAADSTAPPSLRTELEELAARTLTAANRVGGLEQRLAAAELVCALYGITGGRQDSDREKACTQAWMDWSRIAGDAADPKRIPEATLHGLARRRDEIRTETLARIRGERDV